MSRLNVANEPRKPETSEIYDDSSTDSEIRDEQIEKTLRDSRLAGIAWHRHVHECHKALGIPTDETPLSVVPETDFEAPLSSSDEGFGLPLSCLMEAAMETVRRRRRWRTTVARSLFARELRGCYGSSFLATLIW